MTFKWCTVKENIKKTTNECYLYFADDGCPSSGVVKPIFVDAVPGKRSVQFTWIYNVDPEDTGFILKVLNESQVANLTIAVRQHVFRRLGMYHLSIAWLADRQFSPAGYATANYSFVNTQTLSKFS